MRFQFFSKTLPWRLFTRLKNRRRCGSMTFTTVLLFFVFSTLGMSLLHLSRIHLKLSASKKHLTLMEYAAENGIKQGFNFFVSRLSSRASPFILLPTQAEQLLADSQNNGLQIVEECLGLKLPLRAQGNFRTQSWESTTQCLLEKRVEREHYFQNTYRVSIRSEGMVQNLKQKREFALSASLGILTGYLPLPFFPFLLEKKLKMEENFTGKNRITFHSFQNNYIRPKVVFSEEKIIPREATAELSKALKINFFYPQNLSNSRLRTALGLEETDAPVPDGVYLIQNDLGLGGIYVQGDVEEMILAIEEDFQVIHFNKEKGLWRIKFSPSRSETIFTSPEEIRTFDRIPLGIIVINGKVKSLGGGAVDSSGEVDMVKDREIPSILQGIRLLIISPHEITLSSHLIYQGVKWQENIPYVKDPDTQLMIFSTGKSFFSSKTTEGGIVIAKDSPEKLNIHASLTASGKGFTIQGKGKTVNIFGGFQATDFLSQQNALRISFDERLFNESNPPLNAPAAIKPVLYVYSFRVLEWEEF